MKKEALIGQRDQLQEQMKQHVMASQIKHAQLQGALMVLEALIADLEAESGVNHECCEAVR